MKNHSIRNYVFFTAVFLFFVMLLIVGIGKHTYNGFYSDAAMTYDQGWQQKMEDGQEKNLSLPAETQYEAQKLVLTHKLPEHIMSGLSLCVWVQGQSITAQIEGEDAVSYGVEDNAVFGKNAGNYWYMIKLPESAGGKMLTLTLFTPYKDSTCRLDHIYIGTQTSLLFLLFRQYGIGMLFAFLLMVFGLAIAVLYVAFRKKIKTEDVSRTLYLCFSAVLLGMWLFAQSRLSQFFIGNSFVVLLLDAMGRMLLPVPMLYYMAMVKGNHMRRSLMLLAYAFVLNYVVCTVLQFSDLKDFSETSVVTGALYVVAVVLTFSNALAEQLHYNNESYRFLALGIYGLTFFASAELWGFLSGRTLWIGNWIRYGAVMLVFVLMYEAAYRVVKTLEASRNAEYYERLAMVDIMANCYSRTAYNKDVELFEQNRAYKGLCFLFFDLNYLKRINDTYGHQSGDQAIKTCSACIRKVFDRVGKVYRVGGDEFVAIIPNCEEYKLMQRIAVFQKLTQAQNKRLTFDFKVACGYAIYDPTKDKKLEDLIHRADASMYSRKERMKMAQK